MVDLLACQRAVLSRLPYNLLRIATTILLTLSLYLACLATTQSLSLPTGPLFSIFLLVVLALAAGELMQLARIPPMLGMLLVGIALSNVPTVKEMTVLEPQISSDLKTVALLVILMKGGLSLDIMDIKRVGFAVIRLAFLPCLVEASVFAVLSVFLLNLPWVWAFLLGFVIAAVTPAIIVPCLMELKRRKFRLDENNITTMLISASSFDDVVAISAFMVCLSSAFTSDKPLYLQIIQGPLEIVLGILIGVVFGMLLWVIPPTAKDGTVSSKSRAMLILFLSMFSVFGMNYLQFSGSGPLSVIVMSLTAVKGWGGDEYVTKVVDLLWYFGEPLLFGLVGRDIQLELITLDLLWRTLIVIFVALVFRLLAAFLSVSGTSLNFREKIFVCFSWIPKATVQAAIGSYALAVAVEKGAEEEVLGYCRTIVTVAVLVILVSAPLGAMLMYFTAPLLLEKVQSPSSSTVDQVRLVEEKEDTHCQTISPV